MVRIKCRLETAGMKKSTGGRNIEFSTDKFKDDQLAGTNDEPLRPD